MFGLIRNKAPASSLNRETESNFELCFPPKPPIRLKTNSPIQLPVAPDVEFKINASSGSSPNDAGQVHIQISTHCPDTGTSFLNTIWHPGLNPLSNHGIEHLDRLSVRFNDDFSQLSGESWVLSFRNGKKNAV